MGTSSSSSRNTAAQNAAVASLLSGAGTGGINAVRRSANPVNVVGYRPPPVGSSTHGMIVNSPGNYPPTSFQSLQNAASSLAAIQAAQRERDARAAKTSVAPAYQPGMRGRGQPVAPLDSGNAWSPELLEAVMATPVPTPYWQKSLSTLADMAYRGFMAPSRAMNGYYDQFVVDPETGRVISMSDPRMIDDAAALAGFAQTGGIPLVGSRVAAAAIPRATAAAALPRATAAGIDAALTPRQAQFRELMDNLNAGEQAAVPPPVSVGPRIPQGGGQPVSAISPEMDTLERIVGNLGTRAQRDAIRSTSGVYDDTLKDALANALTPPPSVARLSPDDLDALLSRAVEKGPGAPGPLSAEAGAAAYRNARQKFVNDELSSLQGSQLFSDVPPMTTAPAATGRNAFSDIIDAYAAEQRAAKPGELFPDINPAATISDPVDVFGPQRPAATLDTPKGSDLGSYPSPAQWMDLIGPQRPSGTPFVNSFPDPMDVLGPQRPDFMFPDEAADIIRSGGPRVDATPRRFTPTAAGVRSIVGAGAGIPLALLPFADLPSGGGIDKVAPTSDLISRPVTTVKIDPVTGQPVPARVPAPVSNETLNAFANSRGNMSLRLPGGAGQVSIPTKDGTIILPAPEDVAPAVDPADIAKVMPEDTSPTGTAVEDAEATFMSPEEKARRDAAINRPEGSEFGSSTSLQPEPTASSGEQGEGTAPAAGKKFTPGPGQFVGTNGYIYEQSSDGSFEKVGKVPGYTPAQLYEAANKGAFRDPNNIVTGGAKPRKQARKKGERTFFDDAGDFLKDRFDDSVYGKLSKLFFPDDAAAAEAAATGPEAVEYYSTPPSSVPESLISSSGSSKKRKKKDEDETDGGTGGTGTGGTGTGTYTPPTQAMLDALYAPYMRQYTGPGAGYVPGVNPEWRYFAPAFADGGLVDGRLVLGDGGPKEDKIPATIDGVEQAKLSNGEFVMTAAAVKNAGGGDIELGAKRLMDLNNMLSYGRPAERLKVQHVK